MSVTLTKPVDLYSAKINHRIAIHERAGDAYLHEVFLSPLAGSAYLVGDRFSRALEEGVFTNLTSFTNEREARRAYSARLKLQQKGQAFPA